MSTGNKEGLFDDFSESTSNPDLKGGLFDDFSEEDIQDSVVAEEQPSAPVVGKKRGYSIRIGFSIGSTFIGFVAESRG